MSNAVHLRWAAFLFLAYRCSLDLTCLGNIRSRLASYLTIVKRRSLIKVYGCPGLYLANEPTA